MKKSLLSLMALIPGVMLGGSNSMSSQLSGMKPPIASAPMQPYNGMNDAAGMTCPTEEELANYIQQLEDEISRMSPEEQKAFEQEMLQGIEAAYQQMDPEQKAQLNQAAGLFELEKIGEEILSTPEGKAFAEGVQAGAELGAAAKEQEMLFEADAAQNANKPYAPAVK